MKSRTCRLRSVPQRDHRRLDAEAEARACLLTTRARGLYGLGLEPPVRELDCLGERRSLRSSPRLTRRVGPRRRPRAGAQALPLRSAAPLEQRSKRAASARSSSSARSIEVLAGLRGERAHGLVAEERLEHLLAERADVPPATTTSAPVRPPVCAKTASITSDRRR